MKSANGECSLIISCSFSSPSVISVPSRNDKVVSHLILIHIVQPYWFRGLYELKKTCFCLDGGMPTAVY